MVGEKEKKREREKKTQKMRMCACTSNLHAQNRQEEKRKGGCLLARSLVYRARFIFASKRASTNGHVCITMGCGTRSIEEKGGEGRGKRESERSKKHRERARKRTNDRVIWSLLSTVAVDH